MVLFIIWRLEWMKIPFKLTFKREVVTSLLEYNCFNYLSIWILLWILTLCALKMHCQVWDSFWQLKKCFLFNLKSSFRSQDIHFCLGILGGKVKHELRVTSKSTSYKFKSTSYEFNSRVSRSKARVRRLKARLKQ